MLEVIRRLEKQGGLAASRHCRANALRIWIGQVPERAKAIIEIARPDPGFDREILMDALVVLGDPSAAMSFLAAADPRRQAAIAALGAIKPRNRKAGDATLGTLVAIVDRDPDEDMRFTAISAAFDLLLHCKPRAPQWVPVLVNAVTAEPSRYDPPALLHGLWRHAELFPIRRR